jgi:hypothetical protein
MFGGWGGVGKAKNNWFADVVSVVIKSRPPPTERDALKVDVLIFSPETENVFEAMEPAFKNMSIGGLP